MNAVLTALGKGLAQLGDKVVARLLVKTALITLLVFLVLGAGAYFALSAGFATSGIEASGLAGAVAAVLVTGLAFWFLFRVVALAVLQFFADEIVIAVEERHYPQAARTARKLPFRRDLANSLNGAGRALLYNALAAPFALVLVFTAIGPAIVFLIVNAILLGRELTDMAWLRHCGEPPDFKPAPNPVPKVQRVMLGAVIAAIMVVPLANFLGAILGAAAGTHLVHRSIQNGARRETAETMHNA